MIVNNIFEGIVIIVRNIKQDLIFVKQNNLDNDDQKEMKAPVKRYYRIGANVDDQNPVNIVLIWNCIVQQDNQPPIQAEEVVDNLALIYVFNNH